MRTGAASTPNPITVSLDDAVVHAAALMRRHQIGDVVVLDSGRPVGILTDRDIVIGAVAQAPDKLPSLLIRDLLVADELFVAHGDDPLWKTLKRMRDRGVRRMPVVEDDKLVGIFTLDDAIGLLAEQLSDIASLIDRQPTREFMRQHS